VLYRKRTQEFAATSSSSHHGYKVATSENAKIREAIESVERRLAEVYAVIDRGHDIADLTAPNAQKRIQEMDRLGLTYETPKYLTYPEDAAEEEGGTMDNVDSGADSGAATITNKLALASIENFPLVLSASARSPGALTVSTKRPAKKCDYDAAVGTRPPPRIDDRDKDAMVTRVNEDGTISSVAYRNLDSID
jgi:hypothetical protein